MKLHDSGRSETAQMSQSPTSLQSDRRLLYRGIGGKIYSKPTGGALVPPQAAASRSDFALSTGYHQQYLSKNPTGCCGIGGCGVAFKIAELRPMMPAEKMISPH